MRILLLRHAEAVDAGAFPGNDLQRPLTPKGRRDARRMGGYLRTLDVVPEVIVSSPAVRTMETAAQAFGKDAATTEAALAPGASVAAIRRILHAHRDRAVLVLVGHEPDFSTAIASLIGSPAAAIKLSKGACACLKGQPGERFELRWLVGPRQLPST